MKIPIQIQEFRPKYFQTQRVISWKIRFLEIQKLSKNVSLLEMFEIFKILKSSVNACIPNS